MQQVDVVIAGGGMVGASLALALSRYSDDRLKVLVVEGIPIPNLDQPAGPIPYSPSFDARSSALTYGSRAIFTSLGIWPQLSQRLAPIKQIHVSDRGSFGSVAMDCAEYGWEALGYVTENAWLGRVLLNELKNCPNVEFMSPARVEKITPQQGGAEVVLAEGAAIHAEAAVIADGAQSKLREQLGIGMEVMDYRQSALITNVTFSQPHQDWAYERFTERGPMALLPMSASEQGEPRAALVWTTPEDEVESMLQCDDQQFLQQLQHWFGHRVGRFTRVGERFAYPLRLIQAKEQIRRSLVVMGNAAHAMHPVAGQGFNLALRDVVALAKILSEPVAEGESLGDLARLQRYMDRQLSDQQLTIGFSDQVTKLFSNRAPLLSVARGLGLIGMSVLPPIKREFVARAAGMNDGVIAG